MFIKNIFLVLLLIICLNDEVFCNIDCDASCQLTAPPTVAPRLCFAETASTPQPCLPFLQVCHGTRAVLEPSVSRYMGNTVNTIKHGPYCKQADQLCNVSLLPKSSIP